MMHGQRNIKLIYVGHNYRTCFFSPYWSTES